MLETIIGLIGLVGGFGIAFLKYFKYVKALKEILELFTWSKDAFADGKLDAEEQKQFGKHLHDIMEALGLTV